MPRSVGRRLAAATLGLIALLALGAPAVLADDTTVSVAGLAFSPATVTVTEGDTVTWSNGDGVSHTATADDASFDTGSIAGGASDAVTFDAAGTFAYHCTIHASMTGTVVVEVAAAGSSPSPAATGAATTPPTDMDTVGASRAASSGVTGLATGLALLAAAIGVGALLALRLRTGEAEDDDLR